MTDQDWLRLDAQLCFRLYAASRAVTRCYQPLLAELGLTYPQYLAMLVLWEEDGLTVKAMGQRLKLDSGTLTPLLKRMEQAGLVKRQRRSSDEREVGIWLTEAGLALRARAESVPPALLQSIGLTLDELTELSVQLDTLLARATPAASED